MKTYKPLIVSSFVLENVKGRIDRKGFITWATITCHIDGLADCKLKEKAQEAFKKFN